MKEHPENISEKRGRDRSIGYVDEFKDLVREHPGAVKTAMELINKMEDRFSEDRNRTTETLEKNGVSVTQTSFTHKSHVFRVEIENETFAVKTQANAGEQGFEQFEDTKRARKKLEDIPGVEVVDFQLGYTDKKNEKRYFVSKWIDAPRVHHYINEHKNNKELIQKIEERVQKIKKVLWGYHEVETWNMFYDEALDKIIVFDIYDAQRYGHTPPSWI